MEGFLAPIPGSVMHVPGMFQAANRTLQPLAGTVPLIRTPADENIQAGEGDDLSAPNSTTASRINRVVCVSSANVGYSKAAKDTQMLPSALGYDATVEEAIGSNGFAMTLRMTLEYESAFPEEGMVVWVKKHQQLINDDKTSELLLIETAFEDYVQGKWVPIATDVRYAEEAEAVVQAVITSNSGQTAGRVSTTGAVEDAKLGPVGERGRIVLTYRCEQLYSYAEMSMGAACGSHSLVPLGLQLPWAAFDNPGNRCAVSTSVRAPSGTKILDPQTNIMAYRDFQKTLVDKGSEEASSQHVVLPEASARVNDLPTWEFSCQSLPPKPTMVLAWLSVPKADEGWEQVDSALPKVTRATIFKASEEDARLLRVSPPGNLEGHLVRCRVDTEAPTRKPDSVRVHTDITISDASGSTGMRVDGQFCGFGQSGETVRERFNKLEERRLLTRLEAIPKLRQAGILLDQDVWCQIFVIFDHGVKHEFGVEAKVSELSAETVGHLVKAVVDSDSAAVSALEQSGKSQILASWRSLLSQLRGVRAGGMTSFVVGTNRAKDSYVKEVKNKHKGRDLTTYVNFDTDGGNNCGPCYEAIAALVSDADVVQGHVMGVGAWVDQDCAAKVARLLKGSTSLSLSFPDNASSDEHFRQDLSRWIKCLRTVPVALSVAAGSRCWSARHGVRNENGVDCLFAVGEGVSFDTPDVSSMEFTTTVLRGLRAGESVNLYMLSRWTPAELVQNLEIHVGGVRASVSVSADQLSGVALGHHWLSALAATSTGMVENKSVLCKRLRQRIEDDLSFAWNLPTKSGSTSAVGRARTEQRPPVSQSQQPAEPEAPPLVSERADDSWGGSGFTFGSPPPRGGFFPFPSASASGFGFGTTAPTGGAPAMMGGAAPQMLVAHVARSCAPPAPLASAAAPPMSMGFGGGCGGKGGGLFGASSGASAFSGRSSAKERKGSFGASLFGGGEDNATVSGAAVPSKLLQSSAFMHWGASEKPSAGCTRGVRALKHLAGSTLNPPQSGPVAPAQAEDPLVGMLLGPSGGIGGNASLQTPSAVHHGFVCDASQQNPIVGVRYKASNQMDCDISEAQRRTGNFAGGAGFIPIQDSSQAMRWALAAMLAWWPLVWPSRADLFSSHALDLKALPAGELCRAIQNLPDDAQ